MSPFFSTFFILLTTKDTRKQNQLSYLFYFLKKSTNLRGVGSKSVASVTGNSHRHQPSLIPVSERYMAFEKKVK